MLQIYYKIRRERHLVYIFGKLAKLGALISNFCQVVKPKNSQLAVHFFCWFCQFEITHDYITNRHTQQFVLKARS